jgi:hypothetical protein
MNEHMLANGSGLVLESNSLPKAAMGRSFIKVRTYKNRHAEDVLMTEGNLALDNMARRKSLFKDELDYDSEISLMQSERVNVM